jgi:hypothetical protein
MAVLNKLTDYSFILENEAGEQLGILVDYSAGTTDRTGIELFNNDGVYAFNSLTELEEMLGESFQVKEKEQNDSTVSTKEIDGYPVNDTDLTIGVETDSVTGYPVFRKSQRSKKQFYPGWWVVQTAAGDYLARLTLSVDIYEERKDSGKIFGPFKTYMECNYQLKSLQ